MKFATKAIHAGQEPDPVTGAVMPPIYMTSTYMQEYPGVSKGYEYTRAHNPNFTILEKQLAALESAEHGTVFSSGLGALTGLIGSMSSGDSVLALNGLYGGTYRLFRQVFERFGIGFVSLSTTDYKQIEEALSKKPKWLLLETPTNPLMEITDIEAMTNMAKRWNVLTVVDNTFATPYFQNPLKWGADVVWHSTTKYIGGHSDVVGGAMLTNSPEIKTALDFSRKAMGLNPSPFDVWLTSRGVKTLALRMEQHQRNAQAVAEFLKNHPKVKKVYYPGFETHPSHSIVKKQMTGYGGMVSAEFNLSLESTKKLISSFSLFTLAESLGGVESLVSHPVTMTHASIAPDERKRMGISEGLVRFSVGVEEQNDLIDDIKAALEKAE